MGNWDECLKAITEVSSADDEGKFLVVETVSSDEVLCGRSVFRFCVIAVDYSQQPEVANTCNIGNSACALFFLLVAVTVRRNLCSFGICNYRREES